MPNQNQTFYGWKLVAVFFFIYLLNGSFPYYGGTVINTFMAKSLELDRSALGLGFAVFSLFLGLTGPVVGILVNRIGVRNTLTAGCAIIIFGSLLMAFVTSQTWHYVLFFGVTCSVGAAMGSLYPLQAGVTYWFRRQKALALAIVLSAAGVGALIAAPLVSYVIMLMEGNWQAAWFVVAAAAVISAITVLIGVKDKPEDLGQFPDGIDPNSDQADAEESAVGNRVHHTKEVWTLQEALRTRSFWLMVIAGICFSAPFTMCVAHGVIHLTDLGFDASIASTSIGLVVMASIVGRLLGGALGNRIELRYLWAISLVVTAVGVFFLASASSTIQIYLYAACVGAGFGTAYVCMSTMIGNYYGPEAFPPILGVLGIMISVLGALAPLLAGVAYDTLGAYTIAFNSAIAIAMIGSAAIFLAAPPFKVAPTTKLKPSPEAR